MAKQHYCFLKKFNNYFNRKIIKFENLSDYESSAEEIFIPVDVHDSALPFDFNPNDNVTTEIIANEVPFEPDYFLLLDANMAVVQRWFVIEQKRNRQGQWLYQLKRDVIADNLNSLLNAPIYVEKGMLKEDDPFIVNNEGMSLNQIKDKEILITDRSKTAWIVGYMAKNAGGSDIAVQIDDEAVNVNYKTLAEIASTIGTNESTLVSILNLDGTNAKKAYFTNSVSMKVCASRIHESSVVASSHFDFNFDSTFSSGSGEGGIGETISIYPYLFTYGESGSLDMRKMINPFKNAVIINKALWVSQMASILGRSYYFTEDKLITLWSFNGTYVRYNGKYYKLSIVETGTHKTHVENVKKDGTYSALENTCTKTVELVGIDIPDFATVSYDVSKPKQGILRSIDSKETETVISLTLVTDSDELPQLNTQISSTRKTTNDQEYDMFAIPLNIVVNNGGTTYDTVETYARRMASAIALNQNANVYDLQLLPYCPVPNFLSSVNDNEINIGGLTEHFDYDLITKNTSDVQRTTADKSSVIFTYEDPNTWSASQTITLPNVPAGQQATIVDIRLYATGASISNVTYTQTGDDEIRIDFTYTGPLPSTPSVTISSVVDYVYPDTVNCGIIFYVPTSTFETTVDVTSLDDDFGAYEIYNKKILSNCIMMRLVSPNYQGAFEFNLAKNGGTIDYFNILCTYKPYTPVIKVAPNFKWLYGLEYKDNRGLICAGDFSLPRITDEWRTYELNNKNYQNIFNRDIQHLDFMQSIEMRNQLISGAISIMSDAVKGASAGGMVGGAVGVVAGGVIGAGASAGGYGIDVDTMARTHRENKQLAIDKFNYQLGNVKALPYTLTKIGSFGVLSKIFPFVEVYRCSDKELEAFENKIKYESMTVMRIGTLQEFMNFDSDIHYFKGSLIRNDEIADDTHILNAIYEELLKGVYI